MRSAVTVEDVRRIARRRLPRPVFDTLEGGAGDEVSLRANESAFARIEFRPRPLTDVTTRDLSTVVFGERLSSPILLAPTGASRIAHSAAELAVAGAAARTDTVYMQSTVAAFPLEQVARAAPGRLWFQLYLPRTRDETAALLGRIEMAGYRALSVTIDTPVFGNRERDARSRLLSRTPWHPQTLAHGLARPAWAMDFVRGNLGPRRPGGRSRFTLTQTRQSIMTSSFSVTWEDLDHVRGLWKGPLMVKGLLRGDECGRLADAGVDGVIVSNHGGRQLDGVPATVDVLPEVVAAAAGRLVVFVDGGFRRGADVAKALCLGASGVFVGRPYLYGLAAGGEDGVVRVVELLRSELDRTMALLGAATVADLEAGLVTGARAPRAPAQGG
ncbi:alpha-hydroxy acid oxidase [Pseudonocardia ailaonensis]|uniref:Alpha-hydroxy acid oxidase n=1 Tax=Pseudonocardia ailaonensis TaxID=367279 RepID=A0ABN2N795_9PSEU